MQRLNFKLATAGAISAFDRALQHLRELRDGGWELIAIEEGFLGGLPAGQFVLLLADQRETILFSLDAESLESFRAALSRLNNLPPSQRTIAVVDSMVSNGVREAAIEILEAGKHRAATRPTTPASRKRASAALKKAHDDLKKIPSAYDLKEAAALEALRQGKGFEAEQVRALVGDDYFHLLSDMARKAAVRRRGARPKAYVLPGIMGSKIGTKKSRFGLKYNDVIWLDPIDMRLGRIDELKLSRDGKAQNNTVSVGALYIFYLRLKLALDLAGFDADFYDYDWRRPVRDLGQEFARYLNQQQRDAFIVAHSMGGIVTRAALKAGAKNVKRLVMIGTPNYGSFVPAQALRAAYPFLKTLSITFAKDLVTTTDEVFSSFAGLYDLLAASEKFPNFPLFDETKWPTSLPHFRPDLLKSAARAQDLLAPADDRYRLICGVNQDTVVDMRAENGEFVFLQTRDGDGTVPRISAELPGCPTVYVEGSHGSLPNYGIVCDLAVDLAWDGMTARETLQWKPPTEVPTEIRESALRSVPAEVRGLRRGEEASPAIMREVLKPLIALPPLDTALPTTAGTVAPPTSSTAPALSAAQALFAQELKGVVIGRRGQRQLEVTLFPGSLTSVSSRAYVLGLFKGVAPAGAALAVDRLMGGVISDYVQRRMLGGNLGEIFIVPKGRSFIPTDQVIFVGLGTFDRFSLAQRPTDGESEAMRLTCESVVRTCLHTNVEEFATVLLGGSAADDTTQAVDSFTRGFLAALEAVDRGHHIRKITLCETDPVRVTEIRTALLRLATTDLFEHVELELRDLPKPVEAARTPASMIEAGRTSALGRRSAPIYLLARMYEKMPMLAGETARAGRKKSSAAPQASTEIIVETSLLTQRSKAAVLVSRHAVPSTDKTKLLGPIHRDDFSLPRLNQLGNELVKFVFDANLRDALLHLTDQFRDLPLVVVHDAVASQLPWEALQLNGWMPAVHGGMTRQYLDGNLSVAKWLEERVQGPTLEVLLVTNPTGDLSGAEAEGDGVRKALQNVANLGLTERRGTQATKAQLRADFRSGRFDVIHYAGHAFFDPAHPGRAGILCANHEVLSGSELATLSSLPTLVFFNACESARIRGVKRGAADKTKAGARELKEQNISLANAYISGGVANFLGTYWPVGDLAAKLFSETFYPLLVEGRAIGDAVLTARRAVKQAQSVDWADYILFGNPDFVLKRRSP